MKNKKVFIAVLISLVAVLTVCIIIAVLSTKPQTDKNNVVTTISEKVTDIVIETTDAENIENESSKIDDENSEGIILDDDDLEVMPDDSVTSNINNSTDDKSDSENVENNKEETTVVPTENIKQEDTSDSKQEEATISENIELPFVPAR